MRTNGDVKYVMQIAGKDEIILEDQDCIFIPRNGDVINFKGLMVDYIDHENDTEKYEVHEVEFLPPMNIIVRVFKVSEI